MLGSRSPPGIVTGFPRISSAPDPARNAGANTPNSSCAYRWITEGSKCRTLYPAKQIPKKHAEEVAPLYEKEELGAATLQEASRSRVAAKPIANSEFPVADD